LIPLETEAAIVRLYYAEKWKIGTISSQLGVHRDAVRRALTRNGFVTPERQVRASQVDNYVPLILETLAKYPKLTASRLFEMARERGYKGSCDHFRSMVARHRPHPPAEAYLRVRTLPGEQGQVDWAHFGKVKIGQAERRLVAFVMVLSYSRRIFLRFYLNEATDNFLRGHVAAFDFFCGVPRELLYDNLKSAVLERRGEAIHFNPTLLELAAHYHYAPKPVAVARGNEKGRVERAIQYIRHAFFAARHYKDLADLNAQALAWCQEGASQRRCPEDKSLSVEAVYEAERPLLLALPENPFPTDERKAVKVGKTPYVRFDLNDYSVPHPHVRKTLEVSASLETVRVFDGITLIATHTRSFDKGAQIENPQHIEALVEFKQRARQGRGMDRLGMAVPSSRLFLVALAERGGNLGAAVSALLSLLDAYGANALEAAVIEAVAGGVLHKAGVRQVLERHAQERNELPPITPQLPDDPRIKGMVVNHHPLASYDTLNSRLCP
jgi:transposase